ncbi:MAG: circadian clock KaiB family protein [Bacteroidota bacterium]
MKNIEEQGAEKQGDDFNNGQFVLRLFVSGASPNSIRAIANLREICDQHLSGRYSLEIIDVYQQPLLAKDEELVALPFLIKKVPLPERKLIGDLSDTVKVLKTLGINA